MIELPPCGRRTCSGRARRPRSSPAASAPARSSIDGRLREADVGPWQGLTAAEIEDRWPGFLETGRRPPGFEPEAELIARIVPALEDVAAGADARLPIVVSHAGVLRTLRRHAARSTTTSPTWPGCGSTSTGGTVGFGGLFADRSRARADGRPAAVTCPGAAPARR